MIAGPNSTSESLSFPPEMSATVMKMNTCPPIPRGTWTLMPPEEMVAAMEMVLRPEMKVTNTVTIWLKSCFDAEKSGIRLTWEPNEGAWHDTLLVRASRPRRSGMALAVALAESVELVVVALAEEVVVEPDVVVVSVAMLVRVAVSTDSVAV